MQKRKAIVVAILVVFFVTILSSITVVQAAPTATVAGLTITDVAGTKKIDFVLNQVIYIHWIADGTVDITVRDVNNVVVYSKTDQPATASPLQFTPPQGGYYMVSCTGAPSATLSVWTLFVVPESILGTLMATGAGFAAFGTFGVFKIKHAKNKKTH